MAWAQKVLRINLTNGSCQEEPLNMEWGAAIFRSTWLGNKVSV